MNHAAVPAEIDPLILLDVDGVVMPERDYPEGTEMHFETLVIDNGYEKRHRFFRKPVVAALNAASAVAEIRWHTMWGETAKTHLAPAIGLLDFGVTDPFPEGAGLPSPGLRSLTWWKLQWVFDILAANPARPVLLVDDNVRADMAELLAARDGTESLSWIQPKTERGLDRIDLAALAEWTQEPTRTMRLLRGI